MGNTCKSMADSCQCMAKLLQYCKVISLQLIKINGKQQQQKLNTEPPYHSATPLLGMYLKKSSFEKIYGPQYSLQHYLQWPRHGNNLKVHRNG